MQSWMRGQGPLHRRIVKAKTHWTCLSKLGLRQRGSQTFPSSRMSRLLVYRCSAVWQPGPPSSVEDLRVVAHFLGRRLAPRVKHHCIFKSPADRARFKSRCRLELSMPWAIVLSRAKCLLLQRLVKILAHPCALPILGGMNVDLRAREGRSELIACLLLSAMIPCAPQAGRKPMRRALCNTALRLGTACCRRACSDCPLITTGEFQSIPDGVPLTFRRLHAVGPPVKVILHHRSAYDLILFSLSVTKSISTSLEGQRCMRASNTSQRDLTPYVRSRCDGPTHTARLVQAMVDPTTQHPRRASISRWLVLQVLKLLQSPARNLRPVTRSLDTGTENRRAAAL